MDILAVQNKFYKFKGKFYSFLLSKSAGSWGHNTKIYPPFCSHNLKQFFIGNNATIHSYGWIECVTSYCKQKYYPHLEIGDNAYIGHRVHIICCGTMSIGRGVMMADGVYISDNLHGYEDISLPVEKQPLNHPGPVTIEDEVWLGENVCVLPGVTIGKHSVVGANSVVSRNIPPYSVAVGAPAKVIKQYNHESKKWEKVVS